MSSQVRKLEALLTRVQQRRQEPRAAAAAPAALQDEVTRVHRSVPPEAAPSSGPAVPAAARGAGGDASAPGEVQPPAQAPSPLADAMEDVAVPPPSPGDASGPVQARSDAEGRPITLPEVEPPAVPTQADRRIAHVAPEASGAVARSEGEVREEAELTFEQLIARSLSLRPRG